MSFCKVCVYPPQTRKVVTEVKYPTPEGFVSLTAQDVNNYWGEVSLEDVLDPERCKKLKAEDKSKRRALYAPLFQSIILMCFKVFQGFPKVSRPYEVVVVHMHRNGLLDEKNQPTAAAQSGTKLACPAFSMKPSVNVKSTYGKGIAPLLAAAAGATAQLAGP